MTISLPIEQEGILSRLVALGRFATREDALAEAVRRLADDPVDALLPAPWSSAQLEQVYARDDEWEAVERSLAGQAAPEV